LLLHPFALAFAATTPEEGRLVEAVRQGGVVILLRHSATEPGVGDPPGFSLSDCATQRNLSDGGREQARRLGEWFKQNRIVPTSVRNSPWCRTRETSMLAFGRTEDWRALSNLINDGSNRPEQTREVREAIAASADKAIDIYVSHGVSISAFVDVYLQQGEFVAVRQRRGTGETGFEVVGRLLVP
jgi:broad specificity phosphatase PhoE